MKVRFSGLGGQGVVVSGVIYGHAATFDGFNVLQSQSYGSTTRGGVTTSDVTIETSEIHELEVKSFDVVIALCQEACDRFAPMVAPGGCLITERSLVDFDASALDKEAIRHLSVPGLEAAKERLGRQTPFNIVILGVLSTVVSEVTEASLARAIADHVPAGTEDLNRRAFALGRELANLGA